MRNKILNTLFITLLGLCGIPPAAMANMLDRQFFALTPGFYIGGDVGIANLMNKESHAVNPESHQLGVIGAVSGGFIGYDFSIRNRYRLALEGFVDATALQTKIRHAGATYQMNQYYQLGVRVLPEFIFTCHTVGHIVLGYVNGRFQIRDNGVYGFINSNNNQNGFQAGVGLATALNNHFFIRIDALYNTYSAYTKQGIGLPGAGAAQFYTNKFSQLTGELALYYKFIC